MAEDPSSSQAPHESFQALGNENRVKILHALVENEQAHPDQTGMSFSELRKRLEIRDPSKFNYHLKRLRGHFIKKSGDEYRLNNTGRHVVSAVYSGAITDVNQSRSTTISVDCPRCHSQLTARYETENFLVECPTHGTIGQLPLPPGVAMNQPLTRLFQYSSMWGDWYLASARAGICPVCWSRTEVTNPVREPPDATHAYAYAYFDDQVLVGFSCIGCWMKVYAPIGACVVRHPAVTAFLFNHGIDLSERTIFEIDFIWEADNITLIADNPTRIRVAIPVEDETLHLVLDERTTVLDHEFLCQ